MPHFRYAAHGDLAPYLEQYPTLFGFYPAAPVEPIPRQWSSKARRDAGARHRDMGIIVLEAAAKSRFSSPSASPSSSSSASPKPVRLRLPTFAERMHARGHVTPKAAPKPWRGAPLPTFAQRMEAEQDASPSQRRRERLPTFAERMRAKVQAETEAKARSQSQAKSKSKSSKRRTISPPTSRHFQPPSPPRPIRVDEDFRVPGPTTIKRRNAVRRESRFRQTAPMMQTDPATPLPEMSRFDRLLDTIATFSSASSVHLAPSHSHIYSGHPLPVLPRELQTQLTGLHAYLPLSPSTVLPDQNSAAARWYSPFRLFPHVRASDPLSAFDGLSQHPPATQRGNDPLSARWRVLQRLGRDDPLTLPRRQYLPSLIAVLTALELVRHLHFCIERRSTDIQRDVERERERRHGRRLQRKRDPSPPEMPKPLLARARRLDRMETRLRWQVALVAEALWGGKHGKGNVQGNVHHLKTELVRDGFWIRYRSDSERERAGDSRRRR